MEKLATDRGKEKGGRETFRHRLGETRESPRVGAGGERQPASPPPNPPTHLSAVVAFPKEELIFDDTLLPRGAP